MKKKYYFTGILLVVGIVFLFNNCSTKKNTFTRRFYHNMTAHYNAYFNGNESYKEGVKKTKEAHQDDYSIILPVYKLADEKVAESVFPEMDRAFKKASKVIQKHSMFIKGVEYNNWIDDSYMLIGKSHFYKRDYRLAISAFDYVERQYENSELRFDAKLWKAHAFNQLEKYTKAEDQLRALKNMKKANDLTKFYKRNYPRVFAEYYLMQDEYDKAIPYLKEGIKVNRKKDIKTRLFFILGQVYQEQGKLDEATDAYAYVLKKNTPYQMEFNAILNTAKCFDASSGNSKELRGKLLKMAKDEKNKDYLDQIYFVLAELEFKEADTTEGIKYLKRSAWNSVSNNKQKAVSYLKIADIYYSQSKYENAQSYYDSTMAFLPKEYPGYAMIQSKANVLGDLVNNIQTINTQDSLQRLADMSEEDRLVFIEELIERLKKEEQEKRKEEMEKQQRMASAGDFGNEMASVTSGGKWYFYNPGALSQGYNEFINRWGERKLEDNWRLSNKQAMAENVFPTGEGASGTEGKDGEEFQSGVNEDPEHYLKNIPLTDSMMNISDEMIQEAFYNLGIIYNEGLKNYKKSVSSFEELLIRYPDSTEYTLKTYYHLYRINLTNGNEDRAEYYKNLILDNYPESDYAKIIKDPAYNEVLEKRRNAAENLYASTYNYFLDERFDKVIVNHNIADSLYAKSPAMPKFAYLKALSYGKEEKMQEFIQSLESFVQKYPKSELEPRASRTLSLLRERTKGDSTYSFSDSIGKPKEKQYPYTFDSSAIYLYVCIVNIKDLNLNDLKIAFSDYNTKYFSLSKLTISSVFLDDVRQIITISNFKGIEKAMVYYKAVNDEEEIFGSLNPADYQQFLISSENYPKFYRNKDVKLYMEYFRKFILGEEEQ